jgi:methyl-accepting chemotaxis protein
MPASVKTTAAKTAAPASKPAQSNLSVVKSPKPAPRTRPAAAPTLSVVGPKPSAAPKLETWAYSALENSRANTILCDMDFIVRYANQQSFAVLSYMEPNLRASSDVWKNFSANDIVGQSMEFLFAEEPMEFRKATDPRNHPYHGRIKTGPCVCEVMVNGIRDASGNMVGYAVDWERITDKLAQEARVNQLMQSLDQSTMNTFLVGLDFNVLYANKKAYDIMEMMEPNLHKWSDSWKSFHAKDVVGKSIEWLFTDAPEEFKKAADPRNHPYHCIIRTGPCTCEVNVVGTKDEKGQTTGYVVYWERITEKVAQEARVKQLMQSLDQSTMNTFLVGLDFNVLYANKKAFDIMEFMEPNLHAWSNDWKTFHAKDVVGKSIEWLFTDAPAEFKKAADPRNHPYHCVIRTGPCTCEVTVVGTKDDKGEPTGYVVYWERITDKVAQEARVKQLMQTLDQSTMNTFLVGLDYNVLYANKKAFDIMEFMEPNLHKWSNDWKSFRAKEVVGKSIEWLFTDAPEEYKKAKDPRNHPYQCIIRTGPCTCDVSVTSTVDEKGQPTGYAVFWERITEKVEMERKQQEQIEEGKYLAAKIEEMKATALAITQGDLTKTIPVEKDDLVGALATSINDMVANLSKMVSAVQIASDKIAGASADVAAGNDDLSQRTEEQASSLEETASSMEEMTSTVKQNAESARQANELAAAARTVAEKGGAVVGKAVSSMEEINTASKRIADIISVIDEIAFQTNLLALNAAVEAARVGEQGRGFAVVASEVRSLAGRSATAAKEIKALVQDSVTKVQEGSTLVNQSGTQLEEIVGSIKKVADIISEISAASQEQATGIEQVNKAVVQMDQITQQNAAVVEEAAASSASMDAQSKELQNLVSQFKIEQRYINEAQAASERKTASEKPRAAVRHAATERHGAAEPVKHSAVRARASKISAHGEDDGFEEF